MKSTSPLQALGCALLFWCVSPLGGTESSDSASLVTNTPAFLPASASITHIELTPEGELHVYYRQPSAISLLTNPPQYPPDTLWKDVYGTKDGKIIFLRRVEPKVTPATPAKIEWPK